MKLPFQKKPHFWSMWTQKSFFQYVFLSFYHKAALHFQETFSLINTNQHISNVFYFSIRQGNRPIDYQIRKTKGGTILAQSCFKIWRNLFFDKQINTSRCFWLGIRQGKLTSRLPKQKNKMTPQCSMPMMELLNAHRRGEGIHKVNILLLRTERIAMRSNNVENL